MPKVTGTECCGFLIVHDFSLGGDGHHMEYDDYMGPEDFEKWWDKFYRDYQDLYDDEDGINDDMSLVFQMILNQHQRTDEVAKWLANHKWKLVNEWLNVESSNMCYAYQYKMTF